VSPSLTISTDSIVFRAKGGVSDSIKINSNTLWSSGSSDTWVHVSPTNVIGNDSLIIVVDENPDTTSRLATITISAAGLSNKTIKVWQAGKIRLISSGKVVNTTKNYDGTDSTGMTLGIISGISSIDEGKVNVSGSAHFENAQAGTNKLIFVSFNLSGEEKGNYLPPLSDTITTGIINAIQTTVSGVNVKSIKMVDGNVSAEVISSGILAGVESEDNGLVTNQAQANYEDALVGENKTIIIKYTLSGSAVSNYIAPENDTISGKILDNLQVQLGTDSLSSCNANAITLNYTILSGIPTAYKISFNSDAINAGFVNTDYVAVSNTSNNGNITISIPSNAGYGKYSATVSFRNELLMETSPQTFTFYINIPASIIKQISGTKLEIDTLSKQFSSFQWYKDGTILPDQTSPSLVDMDGFKGNYYLSVLHGENKLYTCTANLDNLSGTKKLVLVYPNPIGINDNLTVELSDNADLDSHKAEILIFDSNGKLVYNNKTQKEFNSISFSKETGYYIVEIKVKSATRSFKVLVTP
jgi:hypothetical protein